MHVGVPETGGHDAVVAGDNGGVGGNGHLVADCGDAAIVNQDRAVIDGQSGGRDVDFCVLDGQRAARKFEWRMRSVARVKLDEPDSGAGNNKEDQNCRKETKQPPTHMRTSSVKR